MVQALYSAVGSSPAALVSMDRSRSLGRNNGSNRPNSLRPASALCASVVAAAAQAEGHRLPPMREEGAEVLTQRNSSPHRSCPRRSLSSSAQVDLVELELAPPQLVVRAVQVHSVSSCRHSAVGVGAVLRPMQTAAVAGELVGLELMV